MKSFVLTGFIVLNVFLARATVPPATERSAYDLTTSMIEQTKQLHTLSYRMKKMERIRGEMSVQVNTVTLCRTPFKVYTKQEHPKAGIEVLYVEGSNGGKALVNPNGFPWMNLKLDPHCKIMRKNQHHTILNSGYDHVINILEYLVKKYGEDSKAMMAYQGETEWAGHQCWVIEFNNPHFQYLEYTVRRDETLLTIASREKIGEYMILEKNGHLGHYDDVSEGDIIIVPNDYCSRMTVYIDQERQIPLMFKIYDEHGLYEQYEFADVRLDHALRPGEFTPGFAGYDF